jgi:Tfp pilus assembly protein PilV
MKRADARSRVAGHTLIEVMTAMVLLTVAGTGVVSMQGATTFATQQAQESTIAINFAQTWLDRLKRDALRWTAIGETARQNGPQYLNQAVSGAGEDTWNLPTWNPANPNESHAADANGFDVVDPGNAANMGRIRFCAHFRNVVQHRATNIATGALDTNTVRVDVRVWWVRVGDSRAIGDIAANGCAAPPAQAVLNGPATREVYLSTVLRWELP